MEWVYVGQARPEGPRVGDGDGDGDGAASLSPADRGFAGAL